MSPYPSWLNPGDNAWQLVAATLVGLMSIPGIAVLYAGIVQKKCRPSFNSSPKPIFLRIESRKYFCTR